MSANSLAIRSIDDLMQMATIQWKGGLSGSGFGKPEEVAIMLGAAMELGIPYWQASSCIRVLKGKPSIYGSVGYTLLRRSPDYHEHDIGIEGTGDERHAWITSKRKSEQKRRTTKYSVADAKRAGLWEARHMKGFGAWVTNPDRMLGWRALGFHLADYWSEVLNGMPIAENAEDYEAESRVSVTVLPPEVPAITAPSAPPQQAIAGPSIDQLNKVASLRNTLCIASGLNPAEDAASCADLWAEILKHHNTTSAKNLTGASMEALIADMEERLKKLNAVTPPPFSSSEAVGRTN